MGRGFRGTGIRFMAISVDLRRSLSARLGFHTETGKRPDNQDYVATSTGPKETRPILAAVADGVGGHKGGRVASELTVRSFIDGFYALPETLGPRIAAFRALEAINSWIHAQGLHDPLLERMASTFSALILVRRNCHILHIGDSRIYRLSDGRLERLTKDHVAGRGDYSHILQRAVGLEDSLRLDYSVVTLRQHDRFLLCSDGVHGSLNDVKLQELLELRSNPDETASAIVDAALQAGSQDNATALIVDIIDLPAADQNELVDSVAALPILNLPNSGDIVDGYKLGDVLSDGHYSRLFHASEPGNTRELVIKFPHPRVASEASYRLAFVREAWVAARVRSIYLSEIIDVPPGRQSRLYSLMPFYAGETLETRLKRSPKLSLAEGVALATKLARGVNALHRSGIIHRDIKPDNVILLSDGGLRLVDLGVARVPSLEEFPSEDIPGTPSYMAPELFQGQSGDGLSDQFALGATVYRLFSGAYPYGEIEPFTRPKFTRPVPLSKYRPDLPAWLEAVLSRAINPIPAQRFGDVIEFAHELENGALWAKPAVSNKPSLYERNPLLVWKILTALLAIALTVSLARYK